MSNTTVSASAVGGGDNRQRIQQIVNGDPSRRRWTGWPNHLRVAVVGGRGVQVIYAVHAVESNATNRIEFFYAADDNSAADADAVCCDGQTCGDQREVVRKIAKSLSKNNKHKKGGSDDEDDISDDD